MRNVIGFVVFTVILLCGPSLLAQVAVVSGALPAAALDSTTSEWGNSFLWAFFTSWGLKMIRSNQKLTWFTDDMEIKVQRWVAVGAAVLAGIGVSYTFDKDSGTLTIFGLTTTALLHAVRQFGFQEFAYQSAVKKI